MSRSRSDTILAFFLEQLQEIDGLDARGMFGGYGIYHDEIFFTIVAGGRVYFKTDDTTRERYLERGMGPFRPTERQTLKRYYEVPVEVLEDRDALTEWALEAIEVARRDA